ncbi:PAS domain-containing protein [bacterium]|nr:PAS domain-containing protein [bacterium]
MSNYSPDLSLHIDLGKNDISDLAANISELISASGGQGGIITTWESDNPKQTQCVSSGVPRQLKESLCAEIASFVPEIASGDFTAINDLQCRLESDKIHGRLEGLNAIAVPIVASGRPLGMFCLLHRGEVPSFIKESPQIYSLVADHFEVVLNNAALLRKLMRDRLWYESLLRNFKDGIVIVNMEGKIVGINTAMEKLSGWKVSEVVGKPYHKVFPLKFAQKLDDHGQKQTSLTLGSAKKLIDLSIFQDLMEGELTIRTGNIIDIEVSGVTVSDKRNKICGWFMVMRDISQRKELERLGKIFLSAMSHELQTPIAVIKGFAGLLSDPELELSPETIRQKAALIFDESDRLQKMVRQMLEATSIQAGGIQLHCEAVSMTELIRRAMHRFENMAAQKEATLTANYPDDLPTVWGDPQRIEQVLNNLIENALKHGAGGQVEIAAREEFSTVLIQVSDCGPGISADEQGRIFGMFQRGSGTKTRGSGLGLFIAQAIVEAHGGRIGVETAESGGARFYFTLPKEQSH